jgi:7-cyano-7-deazaguanine synthase
LNNTKNAVILTSGGLDSTTVLAIAREQGYRLYSLSFDYGQRHAFELQAADAVSRSMGVIQHLVLNIDLGQIGGSALTDDIKVPKARSLEAMEAEIPVTYVPARNTIFLSYALAWAEVLPSTDIFIGVNAVDYSGYPDCRPEFITAYQTMANLATKAGVTGEDPMTIHTPLMTLSKAEIITKGVALGVDYAMTHSCYDPDNQGRSCGACDSCLLRHQGFVEAGVVDPTPYQAGVNFD